MQIVNRKIEELKPAEYNSKEILRNKILYCLICRKAFNSKKICKSRLPKYCSRECCEKSLKNRIPTDKQLHALKIGRTFPHSNEGSQWPKESRLKLSEKKKGIRLTMQHRISLSMVKKGKPIQHFINNREKIRIKISKALMGKPQEWNRGINHHNWQGGKTSKVRRYG